MDALSHRLLVIGGTGLAAAVAFWAWPFAAVDALQVDGSDKAFAQAVSPPATPPPAFVLDDVQSPSTRAAAFALRLPAPQPASAGFVPITVAAPRQLRVGEAGELVIGLGANASVGEIGFTVQVDPNVLQVRAGTEGDWAAGASQPARFTAEISSAEDRVHIHSAAPGRRMGATAGSVAIVQFQAMAPGTTTLIISDVALTDSAGKPMTPALSASNLQVTVE